ncbi:galactan 1,3-beta-galactosidase [Coprinopsis marcescibilis]|uniref:Galactan 1,3-beta-galactosidase n=1 Tax=Coprinopsis marcescibilis TaxID=230819 RepID=A0A5C3LD52_COPMA|nr:galactan 1,3-beta-galactosidase [Coprinopsis marcescibilis]
MANIKTAELEAIVSGADWRDTSGNIIQAHGGGILKVDSTYYWHGEDKTHNSGLFRAVACYSSPDLATWTRHNDALTPVAGSNISTSMIVERPKVIYNRRNAEYVMWFHSDSSNYGAAQVGVATSRTPCGPYSWRGSFRPLNVESRDMGIYQDDDAEQTSYLLFASDNNQNFKIARMDANYYNVVQQVAVIPRSTLESPGIVKRNGVYNLVVSKTTGWDPNPNKVLTATSLSGPWSGESDIAPPSTRTYFSQSTFIIPISQNFAVYMGDRWRPTQLGGSRYVWYPLVWNGTSPARIVPSDVWSLNVAAGTYTADSGTSYEAERGTLSGPARLLNNSGFSGGVSVGYIGNGGSVTINNVQGLGRDQWISLHYANADSGWRTTTVSVNGGTAVSVNQPNTGGGGVVLSAAVKVFLRSGANSITVGANQQNYAADLDRIVVYTTT